MTRLCSPLGLKSKAGPHTPGSDWVASTGGLSRTGVMALSEVTISALKYHAWNTLEKN